MCYVCKERASRKLVAKDGNDLRLHDVCLLRAPALLFASNDITYGVTKRRSQVFAAQQHAGIMYCNAKDTLSLDALRERQKTSPGCSCDKVRVVAKSLINN